MNPIYSRRVHRMPAIVSALSRRQNLQKVGTFLPTRTKRLNYDWVRSALKKKKRKRRR